MAGNRRPDAYVLTGCTQVVTHLRANLDVPSCHNDVAGHLSFNRDLSPGGNDVSVDIRSQNDLAVRHIDVMIDRLPIKQRFFGLLGPRDDSYGGNDSAERQ